MGFYLLALFIVTFVPAVAMPGPNGAFAVAQSTARIYSACF